MSLKNLNIDKSWTLFLDRDGVINQLIVNNYVKTIEEFNILPGVPEAIAKLSEMFGRIIIVTNQQGIGKKLMTTEQLKTVHDYLVQVVEAHGGSIDAIYHAPNLEEEQSNMRKPGTGMALKAKEAFPEIDFKKSVIVGDFVTDMEFGKKLDMYTVLISPDEDPGIELADTCVSSLSEFADRL